MGWYAMLCTIGGLYRIPCHKGIYYDLVIRTCRAASAMGVYGNGHERKISPARDVRGR